MADLHQKHRDEEPDDRRPFQDGGQRRLVLWMRFRIRIAHQQRAQPDCGKDQEHRRQDHLRALMLDQHAEDDDSRDKTDGAPDADTRISRYPLFQVGKGNDLELWQRGIPEETVEGHYQGDRPEALDHKHRTENQHRDQRGHAHDLHPVSQVIAQPAPDVRCDDLGRHQDRHQFADSDRVEPARPQKQPPIGNQRSKQREVEQVEGRKAPIRHVRSPRRIAAVRALR